MSESGIWAPERRVLTAGLVLTITLVAFESLAVATAMPEVAADLGGLRLYGWVFSAFMLGNLVGIVVAGQEADRSGPARPFALGLVLFSIGLVIAGTAPSMEVLVAGRLVQGLGAGAVPSTAYVTIARAYREDARPRMMAVLSTAWIVPAMAGPALAGVITQHASWRWVFLGLLPLVVPPGAVAVRALARLGPPGGERKPSRVPDAIRVSAGAGLVLASLTSRSITGPVLAVAGLVLGLPALRRLLPHGVFTATGPLAAAVAGRFAVNFAFFGSEAFIPLTLNDLRHTSTTFAGLPLTASALGWASGAWLQDRQAVRWGARRLAVTGSVMIAVGVCGMLPVLHGLFPPGAAIPIWALTGIGMGLVYPTISLVVLRFAPKGAEGAASSSMQLSDNLGFALGAGLGGAAVAFGDRSGWAPESGVTIAFAIPLAVALVGLWIAGRFPHHHTGSDDQRERAVL